MYGNMTVGDTPEQGGRDEFDVIMANAWGAQLQELDTLLEYSAIEADTSDSDDSLELHVQAFLTQFSANYPSYAHTAYESRVEAIGMAEDDSYLSSPRSDWSALYFQITHLVRIFDAEPETEPLTEEEQQELDQLQLHQKIKFAGDYWFHLGDDAFWLIKMLDELCPTNPPISSLSRDTVQGLYISAFGRKPEQDALYVQCIQEFTEERGEEVEEQLSGFFESGDADKDAQVRASLFAIATLNAVEVFEDAFNTKGMPPGGVATRKRSADERRRLLRMDIATVVCGAGMTIEQMLDQSQPMLDELANTIFQFLYRQIIAGES